MRRVAMVLVLAGCGVAQPQVDAGAVNRPPRILQTKPELRTTYYASNLCPSLNTDFKLTVEDLDRDVLNSMWFIDPAPGSVAWLTSPLALTADTGVVQAPSAVSFHSTLSNLPTGVHLVTAWVADTVFNEPIEGKVTVVEPGATDSYTWVLDLEPCP